MMKGTIILLTRVNIPVLVNAILQKMDNQGLYFPINGVQKGTRVTQRKDNSGLLVLSLASFELCS